MISIPKKRTYTLSQEQVFMVSVLIVNGGNYAYNLILGRLLGPEQFSDAAVLITFLLVLSFVAMTFQLATAKFSVTFNDSLLSKFVSNMHTYGILIGVITGLLTIVFADQLQALFNTSSSGMFVVFGIGIPLYFMMSVNRGVFQGKKQFKMLSITYQLEMLSRLVITLGLIVLFDIKSSIVIAIGILGSFGFGLIPFKFKKLSFKGLGSVYAEETKQIRRFFIITAFYEFTQIIINNSDILLVKHFFESWDAGLYAALALIGRIVYFIAWMFVMLLLPTVVQLKKEGKATAPILFKYVGYIACISLLIIGATAVFPEMAIQLLFGEQYLEIAPLLWKYALATGLFAIANIFAYYYLSLDKNVPVIISGVFGMLQMGLVIFFHDSLAQVVHMQIAAMFLLLATQVAFFFFDAHKK
jgi:O-antigen/teichoic acid export membrane protein